MPLFGLDRRPVRAFALYNGNYATGGTWGLNINWYNGGVPWLITQLDASYAVGFRRFYLSLPAGRPNVGSGNPWPMCQWPVLNDSGIYSPRNDVQEDFRTDFIDWLTAHTDAFVWIYMGGVTDGEALSRSTTNGFVPEPSNVQHERLLRSFLPTISCNCMRVGYFFDNSSPVKKRFKTRQLIEWLNSKGVRGGAEAIPNTGRGLNNVPDPLDITKFPLICIRQFLEPYSVHGTSQDTETARSTWTFDTATTEVLVILHNFTNPPGALTDLEGAAKLQDWHNRGFVLGTFHSRWEADIISIAG